MLVILSTQPDKNGNATVLRRANFYAFLWVTTMVLLFTLWVGVQVGRTKYPDTRQQTLTMMQDATYANACLATELKSWKQAFIQQRLKYGLPAIPGLDNPKGTQ